MYLSLNTVFLALLVRKCVLKVFLKFKINTKLKKGIPSYT